MLKNRVGLNEKAGDSTIPWWYSTVVSISGCDPLHPFPLPTHVFSSPRPPRFFKPRKSHRGQFCVSAPVRVIFEKSFSSRVAWTGFFFRGIYLCTNDSKWGACEVEGSWRERPVGRSGACGGCLPTPRDWKALFKNAMIPSFFCVLPYICLLSFSFLLLSFFFLLRSCFFLLPSSFFLLPSFFLLLAIKI